jgi:hypothetical protein
MPSSSVASSQSRSERTALDQFGDLVVDQRDTLLARRMRRWRAQRPAA